MAVCAWLLEKGEHAITMGLHLLPDWYFKEPIFDHLAEHEGCADEMDELHMRKIDLCDEIFVVDWDRYIGKSTSNEIDYAKKHNKNIRYLTDEPLFEKIKEMIYKAQQNIARMKS